MSEPYLQTQPGPMTAVGWVGVQPYMFGRHTYVSEFTHIGQNTVIGSFCSIGNLCTIGAQRHRLDCLTSFPFDEIRATQEVVTTAIGSDVWIGCNAVVMAGVVIEHGAVIGAGAVVTKNVPPYAIVVGNPARVIRYRFPPDIIEGLLQTKWWDLPAEEIKRLPMTDPAKCIEMLRNRR